MCVLLDLACKSPHFYDSDTLQDFVRIIGILHAMHYPVNSSYYYQEGEKTQKDSPGGRKWLPALL